LGLKSGFPILFTESGIVLRVSSNLVVILPNSASAEMFSGGFPRLRVTAMSLSAAAVEVSCWKKMSEIIKFQSC
jgi:hypothetical protein